MVPFIKFIVFPRHIRVPFSKFAFEDNLYEKENLTSYDITNVQGYSMFMAIVSAGKGVGAQEAMDAYFARVENTPLEQLCTRAADLSHMKRYQQPENYP